VTALSPRFQKRDLGWLWGTQNRRKCRSFDSAEVRFAQDDCLFWGYENAGPSTPLKNASLRMTDVEWDELNDRC
jgi:hypothetical protein